jgi:hypothetical protein
MRSHLMARLLAGSVMSTDVMAPGAVTPKKTMVGLAPDVTVCTVPSGSVIVAVSLLTKSPKSEGEGRPGRPATGRLLLISVSCPGGQLQLIVDLFQ